MTTVAVIGGGIAGLSAGEALMRQLPGATIRVLEAEATPGGKIATRQVDGFVVETGPHGFLDKEPAMQSLVQRLGLTDVGRSGAPACAWSAGEPPGVVRRRAQVVQGAPGSTSQIRCFYNIYACLCLSSP